jgi:hypothetical protein
MRTYSCKEAFLSFDYPTSWTVEQEKNVISVYDSERGLGALQFSFYQVEHPEKIVLSSELEDYISRRHGNSIVLKENGLAFSDYLAGTDNRFWKYWLFLKCNILIFASYNCNQGDVGKEDEIISNILNSANRVS